MRYTFTERAFHPDESFGLGGFGFEGDNRGFSFMQGDTSRVRGRVTIDTRARTISSPPQVDSSPSTSPLGIYEDYSSEDRKPQGEYLSRSISPFIEGGTQNVAFVVHTWGKNHAFRLTQDGFSPSWVIPDLDVTVHFTMRIDLAARKIRIESTLTGDGFPNTEVFISDSLGTTLMLNTHHRIGHAAGQLIGNRNHLLASTEIVVDCTAAGGFTGQVQAVRCVDFMPFDRDLIGIAGTTDFAIPNWNALHLSRNPTEKGFLGLDTDDDLPIPGRNMEYPRDGNWGIDDFFDPPDTDDVEDWDH